MFDSFINIVTHPPSSASRSSINIAQPFYSKLKSHLIKISYPYSSDPSPFNLDLNEMTPLAAPLPPPFSLWLLDLDLLLPCLRLAFIHSGNLYSAHSRNILTGFPRPKRLLRATKTYSLQDNRGHTGTTEHCQKTPPNKRSNPVRDKLRSRGSQSQNITHVRRNSKQRNRGRNTDATNSPRFYMAC